MGVTKIAAGFASNTSWARAGRDTYERIVDGTRRLTNQPAAQCVQQTAHNPATTVAKTAAVDADEVTSASVETVAGIRNSSRKGGNHAAASADTAVRTAASVGPSILGA